MVFSSAIFLFLFLPIVFILYYILPKKLRNTIMFLASLLFYAWGEPIYIFIMLFSTVFDYENGRLIEKCRKQEKEKICKVILILSIVVNLGLLMFFKYTDFFVGNINGLFGLSIDSLGLALPIGISFYTFQTLSYTIDVYRGVVQTQQNMINFGMYVSMFPQLIAGPIVRYSDIKNQVDSRDENVDEIAAGIRRFIMGLAKKIIIANQIGILWDEIESMTSFSTSLAWIGAIAFTLQIYFDFSGYSDMAIGLGHMFGFTIPENFKHPYESRSITEFWRKWHITLGTWFREYIYIPLGGNRNGVKKQVINLFIVWFLTGFWHGAGWNFILWGVYYFILLMLEKLFLLKWMERWPQLLRHIYTLLFVVIGWVIFACTDLNVMCSVLKAMFGLGEGIAGGMSEYYMISYGVLFIIAAILATSVPMRIVRRLFLKLNLNNNVKLIIKNCLCVFVLIVSIAFLVGDSYNPFLYFRF
ncbi:MBOAT family protein [uncultured Eubacterium sp.]|uniref:MBOAT family O-acyltransferase n=1 Tax=uncultured Eubacterium sp. TaxID=165185 RepID=UPI002672111A|nr:MBOAT family protein [uncultured Eubacterium sp.]